jgi:hypothetical protein
MPTELLVVIAVVIIAIVMTAVVIAAVVMMTFEMVLLHRRYSPIYKYPRFSLLFEFSKAQTITRFNNTAWQKAPHCRPGFMWAKQTQRSPRPEELTALQDFQESVTRIA